VPGLAPPRRATPIGDAPVGDRDATVKFEEGEREDYLRIDSREGGIRPSRAAMRPLDSSGQIEGSQLKDGGAQRDAGEGQRGEGAVKRHPTVSRLQVRGVSVNGCSHP
jgi:hypothetical protein